MAEAIESQNSPLEEAVSSLNPSTEPDKSTQTPEPAEPTESEESKAEAVENPAVKQVEGKKTRSWEKNYQELRSLADRQYAEQQKRIQEMDKQLKQFAPYQEFMPMLQKALNEKKQAELKQQYAQNPVEAQKALLEQMLQEKLQPLQQQVETQQQEKFVNDTVGYIQQKYGQSAYEEMRPMMKQILDSTAETSGPEVADLLARNPDSLFMMAFGNAAYQKIIEYNKNQQAGVQNKQNLQRVASGDSRPNRSVKPMVNTGTTSDIEQKVWDYLEANK